MVPVWLASGEGICCNKTAILNKPSAVLCFEVLGHFEWLLFSQPMEDLLRDIPHVIVYLNDILITGVSEAEHAANLENVLNRLEKAGLRLKQAKCKFMEPSVTYLGYLIDAKGLHSICAEKFLEQRTLRTEVGYI